MRTARAPHASVCTAERSGKTSQPKRSDAHLVGHHRVARVAVRAGHILNAVDGCDLLGGVGLNRRGHDRGMLLLLDLVEPVEPGCDVAEVLDNGFHDITASEPSVNSTKRPRHLLT